MELYEINREKPFLVSQKALIAEGDKLLLLRESEELRRGDKERWDIPGGFLEPSESLEEGLKREVREETSLEIEIQKPVATWSQWKNDFEIPEGDFILVRIVSIGYLCKKLKGEVKLSWEHDKFIWAKKKELKELPISSFVMPAVEKF